MGIFQKKDNWYIDYYVNGRRKREKIGPSKKLAGDVLHKRKIEIAENRFLDIRREKKVRFGDFTKTYLELHCKANKKSWKKDITLLRTLTKYFGNKCLYEIAALSIEEFKNEQSKVSAPATVNRKLTCLKHLLKKAVEWGKLGDNPARNIKLLRENNQRLRYLEKEEIKKLVDACSAHLRPIVIVGLNTGMRKSEILCLKWRDIDFEKGIIYLRDTKNGDNREVYLNELAKKALIAVRKHPNSPYVFCGPNGKPYTNVRRSFFTALKKCGINDFHFHDLRHTFASQLVMAGIDLNTVRDLMGHKSIEMTLRYAHLSPDHKKRAIEIFGRRMDTIWTPAAKVEVEEEKVFLHNPLKKKE
ncbi:MAG: site-specific integrase [Syntrophorhabdaceae bacterium]|nr:site-specific integrase [Syntrophorhabdaceae bacterium]